MQEKRFLSMTAILIVLLGVPAVWSVVREPQTVTVKESSVGAETRRQPASVVTAQPTAQFRRNAIHSKSVVLDYDCKHKPNMEVDGTLLRLKGANSSCLSDKWTEVSVTNHSNGFTASVIFLKNGFTTDFIDLKEGDNDLEIHAKDDKGQAVSQKITVKRRSIASVEDSTR
jgi:hypothetical protein